MEETLSSVRGNPVFPSEKSLAEQDDRFCGPVESIVSGARIDVSLQVL
jgi:hypothetical protein